MNWLGAKPASKAVRSCKGLGIKTSVFRYRCALGAVSEKSLDTSGRRTVLGRLSGWEPGLIANQIVPERVWGSRPQPSARGFLRLVDTGTSCPASVESPLPGNNWRPRPITIRAKAQGGPPVWGTGVGRFNPCRPDQSISNADRDYNNGPKVASLERSSGRRR